MLAIARTGPGDLMPLPTTQRKLTIVILTESSHRIHPLKSAML